MSSLPPEPLRRAHMLELLSVDGSMGHQIDIRRQWCREGAASLRALHAENEQLRAKLKEQVGQVAIAERKACIALVERHYREYRDIAGENLARVIWEERGALQGLKL
ncbi:hypothetical protein [Tardiphaga sp. 862_B3_N1_1]|uniref:hypothetical protein n=1 Tax=Tardiphaga sp. 862_B3_N1_1 TaxID=3240763 RepID=UPI003F8A2AA8